MWLNNDRVFYAGLLGAMSVRTMGGWLVYVSLGSPIRIAIGDAALGVLSADPVWQSTDLAVVPPYTPHRVVCDERLICSITVEPETVDDVLLPDFMRLHAGAVPGDWPDAAQTVQRVRAAQPRWPPWQRTFELLAGRIGAHRGATASGRRGGGRRWARLGRLAPFPAASHQFDELRSMITSQFFQTVHSSAY
jgi:hypothetical protein